MKARESLSPLGAGLFFCLILGVAGLRGQISLPVEYDFELGEGFAAGEGLAQPFASSGAVSIDSGGPFFGEQSVVLEPGDRSAELRLSFDDSEVGAIRFVDFFLKPAFAPLDDLPGWSTAGTVAMTAVVGASTAAQGSLFAADGNGSGDAHWVDSLEGITGSEGRALNWMRLTYRLDYGKSTWDLYLNNRMILSDLGFLEPGNGGLSSFRLSGDSEKPVYFDYFYAGGMNPLFEDEDKDGMDDAYELAEGLLPGVADRDGDRDLDSLSNVEEYRLGLKAGLADSDGDGLFDGLEFGMGTDPGEADGYALETLPYYEDFESHALGIVPPGLFGTVSVDATMEVVSAPESPQGERFLEFLSGSDEGGVVKYFEGDGESVVWLDFQGRLGVIEEGAAPEISPGSASVFYQSSEGRIMALDGSGSGGGAYRSVGRIGDAEGWRRVTVRLDYPRQKWSLWLDDVRVADDYGYAWKSPYLNRLKASGSAGARLGLDEITVSASEPQGLDDDWDGLANADEAVGRTDSGLFDTDDDGLADSLEEVWGLNPLVTDANMAKLSATQDDAWQWLASFSLAEGYGPGQLDRQLGWTASDSTEVSEDETVSLTDSLEADHSFERLFGIGENRRIWVGFRAKLVAGAMPGRSLLGDGPSVALWGLSAPDTISIWDGPSESWSEHESRDDGTEWNEYAMYFDYVEKTWLIAQNGVVVASGLPFVDEDLIVFSRFRAIQAKPVDRDPGSEAVTALFDDFVISTEEPAGMDFDGDGLDNDIERNIGSDLWLADTDGDGLDDSWEYNRGFDPLISDPNNDLDGDNLTLLEEYALGTNPSEYDTDGDGLSDGMEIAFGLNPLEQEADINSVASIDPWALANISANNTGAAVVNGSLWVSSNGTGFKTHGNDSVAFAHQAVSGNFEFSTKVEFPANGKPEWRGGIMIRESMNPKAAFAGIFVSSNGTIYQRDRSFNNGKVGRVADSSLRSSDPFWLKIRRQGNQVEVSVSSDGEQWNPFYQTTMTLPDEFHYGMVVSSGNADLAAGAKFSGQHLDMDMDSDGLLASEEAALGTVDSTADTDGDGITDHREVLEFFSDPSVADLGSVTPVLSSAGRDLDGLKGQWINYGRGKYADTIRGSLIWNANLEESGLYQLTVGAGFAFNDTHDPVFSIEVEVDGQYAGELVFDTDGVESKSILLPWLNAGGHEIKLIIANTYLFRKILVDQAALEQIGRRDSDEDGIVDWVENRLSRINGVEASPIASLTSPISLTGSTRYPLFAKVDGGSVEEGPNHAWVKELHLGETESTSFDVSLENGAVRGEVSATWIGTDLFAGLENIVVRKGDSLKLLALPENADEGSSSRLFIDGVLLGDGPSAEPVIHQFTETGEFEVSAVSTTSVGVYSASLQINVVEAGFASSPLAVESQGRIWKSNHLPVEAVVEADRRISFDRKTIEGEEWVDFQVKTDSHRDRVVWARLGEDGPVLDRQVIRGTEVATLANTGLFIEHRYDDGYTDVLMPVVVNRVASDLKIAFNIFIGGVHFDDGTTYKELTASDFDETGVAFLRFLRPPGRSATCHSTKVYENETYIGKNK